MNLDRMLTSSKDAICNRKWISVGCNSYNNLIHLYVMELKNKIQYVICVAKYLVCNYLLLNRFWLAPNWYWRLKWNGKLGLFFNQFDDIMIYFCNVYRISHWTCVLISDILKILHTWKSQCSHHYKVWLGCLAVFFVIIRGGYWEPRETIIPAQFDPNCRQMLGRHFEKRHQWMIWNLFL